MKKFRKVLYAILVFILLTAVFALTACYGASGKDGNNGIDGVNGKSAYELAVEKGYVGSETEWLASLAGENGQDGQSAYELAVKNGYVGSETKWLTSLIGADGINGQNGKSAYELAKEAGFEGSLAKWLDSLVGKDGINGKDGIDGVNGKSAYDLALENGFEGSVTEWLASLVGKDGSAVEKGDQGDEGKSAYEVAVDNGYSGTQQQWLASLVGAKGDKGNEGKSAYELAVENGYVGTERQWIDSLTGAQGEKGDKGDKGSDGQDGTTPHIGENGNWWLGEIDTGVSAITIGIETVTIDYKGHVIITLTDGTKCEVDITDTACDHEFETVVISPTCTEKGYTKYTCKKCDYSYSNNFTPESGHHFADLECVFCGEEEPFGEITVNTDWYSASATSYVITTREQLAGLAYLVNRQSVNFSGKTVSLGNNIDLAYAEWIPIGNESASFAGTFNGKNLTVSNLKITQQESYVGLFGYVTGTIYNFKVANAQIRVDGIQQYVSIACGYNTANMSGIEVKGFITAENSQYVGGVVGYTTGNNVTNCTSSARILGEQYVGGVIGATKKSASRSFQGLSNNGIITGAKDYIGGVIGAIDNSVSANGTFTMTITECTNDGNIKGTNYVGGLFGYVYADATYNSYAKFQINATELHNTGNVTGTDYVGGLFGYCYSDVTSSYLKLSSSGAVITGKAYVGGLGGSMENIQVIDCDNSNSEILATGYVISGSNNLAYVGGYVGYGYYVSGCTNHIAINYDNIGSYVGGIIGYATGSLSSCENTADITGYSKVGGIAGCTKCVTNVVFDNLKNSGAVTGSKDYVGGVIGAIDNSVSANGTFTMTITECTNDGNIKGTNYVGGLFGYVYADATYNSYAKFQINATELHNTGNVTGTDYVGGLMGFCYSDTASTLKVYSSTGTVTATGTHTGDYIGSSTNLTISLT